ncbi:MAG: hypothetical protein NT007_09575 [Candidatus Kapabacteria bacterium]|nr:hypothetical protein [Candidatus Kapabacteria bacterium]
MSMGLVNGTTKPIYGYDKITYLASATLPTTQPIFGAEGTAKTAMYRKNSPIEKAKSYKTRITAVRFSHDFTFNGTGFGANDALIHEYEKNAYITFKEADTEIYRIPVTDLLEYQANLVLSVDGITLQTSDAALTAVHPQRNTLLRQGNGMYVLPADWVLPNGGDIEITLIQPAMTTGATAHVQPETATAGFVVNLEYWGFQEPL